MLDVLGLRPEEDQNVVKIQRQTCLAREEVNSAIVGVMDLFRMVIYTTRLFS